MTAPKFKPGRKVTSVAALARLINAGRWVYHRHKPMHPGWTASWSIHYAQVAIGRGWLREAVEVPRG